MSCEDVRETLPDYLAGVLPADENRRLQSHLETCSACALEVSTIEQTWSDMALVADEQPSERLRASFYPRLHEAEQAADRPTLASRLSGLGAGLAALWPRRPAFPDGGRDGDFGARRGDRSARPRRRRAGRRAGADRAARRGSSAR
jgi:anti-sigma factor RsiW